MPKFKKYVNIYDELNFSILKTTFIMSYWQKIGKCFSIKVAFPHLFLGVIAATLSLSSQASLPANIPTTHIITIASVIVSLHETSTEADRLSEYPKTASNVKQAVQPFLSYTTSSKLLQLNIANGIRAGPSSISIN